MNALSMSNCAMILLFLENSILLIIICACGCRQNPIKQQNYLLNLQVSKKASILEVQQFDLSICLQSKVIYRHCLKCARRNDCLYKRHRINIQKNRTGIMMIKEIFVFLFIMSFYSRDNPFKRQYNLIPQPYPRRYPTQHYNNHQGQVINQDLQSKSRALIDSPFEKSRFEDVFSGKNNKSQSRLIIKPIASDYGQPSIPLSRYESRMRLRQIDNENWKREKLHQQKYKLEHFGPEALRYKSYSTGHSSFNHLELNSRANQNKYRQQQSRQGSATRKKDDQNPQTSYMLYFDKSQNVSAKRAQSNNSISNMKTQHHHSGFFGQRSLHSGISQSINKFHYDNQAFEQQKKNGNQHKEKANHSHARNKSKDFDQVNRSENKNYRNDYELEYWNNSKRQDQRFNGSKQHQESKKLQKKQTPTFNNYSKEYMQNSFNKSSQKGHSYEIPIDKQMSSKSFDSNSDLINENFYGSKGQNDKKSMSYGSNEQKDKPNFEDSDYIRQNDEQKEPVISKAMKFSSSFEQDSGKRVKPSHFGFKRPQNPNRIVYSGRQFYLLNII